MKRALSLVLTALLLLLALAGCASPSTSPSASPSPSAVGSASTSPSESPSVSEPASMMYNGIDITEPVKLTWMYIGNTVTNDTEVMTEVNKYLKEKLNAELEMIWCGWGDDFDNKVTMAINGSDPMDIFFTSYWNVNEYAATAKKGAFIRLDDPSNDLIAKAAPNFFSSMPSALKDGILVDGAAGFGVYAMPAYKEVAQQYVWELNMPMLEKYSITADQITSYYDLGPLLEKAKAGEGKDFYPLSCDTEVLSRMAMNIDLIDPKGLLTVLIDREHPGKSQTTIINRYASEDFAKYATQQREYFTKGYINPVCNVAVPMNDAWVNARTTGAYLISNRVASPGYNVAESAVNGYQMDIKNSNVGWVNLGSRGALHAVSSTSANPERAVALLDLVNSDPYLHTLLAYGVEDLHYNLVDGRVKFTEKKTAEFNVWKAGLGQLAMYPLTVDDPAGIDMVKVMNEFNNVEAVPYAGFTFDSEPVQTQYAALSNVVDEYQYALLAGSVDPATALPAFLAKLTANGIDEVIAEANRQMEALMATKG